MQTKFKRKEYRNQKLIKWMHGKPCQVSSPFCEGLNGANTVPAHSNSADYGKGKGQKADDIACAISCQKCHWFLDLSEASRDVKRFYHDRAIIRTIRLALDEGILK